MITLYRIGHLPNTPFNQQYFKEDLNYLQSKGIEITNSKKADILVAGNHNSLKRFILRNPFKKRYLLWTNEPRFSQVNSNIYFPFKIYPKVHVMNVYTGDVFINNVTYQYNRFQKNDEIEVLNSGFTLSSKKIAALMSYYSGGSHSEILINGINIDLVKKRSEIANYGLEIGVMDIYGRGWPVGVSQEDSRMVNRHERKNEILKKYHFNLCFENTVYPQYITEKIWESIENWLYRSNGATYFGSNSATLKDPAIYKN